MTFVLCVKRAKRFLTGSTIFQLEALFQIFFFRRCKQAVSFGLHLAGEFFDFVIAGGLRLMEKHLLSNVVLLPLCLRRRLGHGVVVALHPALDFGILVGRYRSVIKSARQRIAQALA